MPIISGDDSDFGRLVVEEFKRRAQRMIDLGLVDPDAEVNPALDTPDTESPAKDRSSGVEVSRPDGTPTSRRCTPPGGD